MVILNYFIIILHLLPQYSAENHLNILNERIVPIVVTVQTHLIRIDNIIIVPYSQFLLRQAFRYSILHSEFFILHFADVFCNHFVFQTIL